MAFQPSSSGCQRQARSPIWRTSPALSGRSTRLGAAQLIAAGFSDLSLRLHPSCRLIASPFPVDHIWQVHQKACSERETVDLDAGGVRLLVHRREGEVGWIDLPPPDFAFLDGLIMSGSLREALTFARAVDHGFDPTGVLAALIEDGLVSLIDPVH